MTTGWGISVILRRGRESRTSRFQSVVRTGHPSETTRSEEREVLDRRVWNYSRSSKCKQAYEWQQRSQADSPIIAFGSHCHSCSHIRKTVLRVASNSFWVSVRIPVSFCSLESSLILSMKDKSHPKICICKIQKAVESCNPTISSSVKRNKLTLILT